MQQLFTKTDKHLIPTLPRYAYEGRIHVVQSESEAQRAVEALRHSPLLGIDTETRPTFHRGETHQVALLQVADDNACFLFRLNQIGLPPCVSSLLSDPNVTKVGLSLKDDLLMLRRRDDSFHPSGWVELQDMARRMGIEDMSLQKLYANVFRKRISKSARLTNWEADVLSDSQKTYAATDAVTCLHLYRALKNLGETRDYSLITPTTPTTAETTPQ